MIRCIALVLLLLLAAVLPAEDGLQSPDLSPLALRIKLRERKLAEARGELPPPPPDTRPFPVQVKTARALLRPGDRMGLVRALRSQNPAMVVAALELEREGRIRYSRRLLLHLRDHTRSFHVQNAAGVLLLMRDDEAR